MLEIGILYDDLTQVWKPFSEIDNFRTDGVLTITFTTERGNRRALCARMWSRQNSDLNPSNQAWWGEDNYAIGIMPDARFFTYQWDDTDEFLFVRSTIDGKQTDRVQRPSMFPDAAKLCIFKGAYVEPEKWEKALVIFETEMF